MVRLDLAALCRPHPRKWYYPLSLLREDGHSLYLQSGINRTATRLFLRQHKLLELFDDIEYEDLQPSPITDLRHLPPLCRRAWTRERLTFSLFYGGV